MRWLSYRDLEDRGLGSRTTLWRMVKNGELPPPQKISDRSVGWQEPVIEKWERSRPVVRWAPRAA